MRREPLAAKPKYILRDARPTAVEPKVSALPLLSPDRRIRIGRFGLAFWAGLVGLAVLCLFPWLFSNAWWKVPSLAVLLTWSFGVAALYVAVRFAAYWCAWAAVIRRYPLVRGVHPAARGELPRCAFLVVVLAPLSVCSAVLLVLSRGGTAFSPEIWLALAVAVGISVRDLRIARHLVFLAPDRWIKETPGGLDTLRPTDNA